MVREAVVAMGGRIRAESNAATGTAFTITFPAVETKEAAVSSEASSQ